MKNDQRMEYYRPAYETYEERETVDLITKYSTEDSLCGRRLAEKAAHMYFDPCEYNAAEWPMLFRIYLDGDFLGEFSVDMEISHEFYASQVE